MHASKMMKSAIISAATVGVVFPQMVQAASPQVVLPSATRAAAPVVLDVALSKGGTLRGQVVDAQGVAMAASDVKLVQGGHEVASARTDAAGHFAVSGLRGGSYTVLSGEGGGAFRLWSADSAPPAAQPGVLVVSGQQVARGQGFNSPGGLIMLGLMGGIVTGGMISANNSSGS